MDKSKFSRPMELSDVNVTDGFWEPELELVRKEVIPYQWNALNDKIEGAEPSFCMRNYKLAAKLTNERIVYGKDYKKAEKMPALWGGEFPDDLNNSDDRFYGYVFQDSDFSKWIEAVAYSLTRHPDKELEACADAAIDTVCAAQLENGYLDTYYIISDIDKAFTNLKDCHELYCFGHLTEGAVAYYKATGKDKLLKTAEKFADYIDSRIGAEEGKLHGYPGHEIAEMALVRLYEVTGNDKYLKLSEYFINERGKRPYYFDIEDPSRVKKGEEDKERYHYNQANKPVRELSEATGHAVRAVYLYSGMADIARLTGDEELLKACDRLFDNIVKKRMYITGGIGSSHLGECFTFDYDLPNDTAYAETCASIGLVFFARRMLEIKADRKYSDIMERALYNGVLSGMALDGKSFFYVNPLEVYPEACKKDERKFHVRPVRQKWFGCACCPPNIARLISSVASYAYTENDDTLFVHLYIGGDINKKFKDGEVTFRLESSFPWNSHVKVSVASGKAHGTIALRIPGWCDTKPEIKGAVVKDGYLYITKDWQEGEEISLDFPMEIKLFKANTNVREDAGKLCIMRGPLVYCLEEIDNGKNLQNLTLDINGERKEFSIKIGGRDMVGIKAEGYRVKASEESDDLYSEYTLPEKEDTTLTFIPYFAWNNRGEGEMTVWL